MNMEEFLEDFKQGEGMKVVAIIRGEVVPYKNEKIHIEEEKKDPMRGGKVRDQVMDLRGYERIQVEIDYPHPNIDAYALWDPKECAEMDGLIGGWKPVGDWKAEVTGDPVAFVACAVQRALEDAMDSPTPLLERWKDFEEFDKDALKKAVKLSRMWFDG